MENLKCIMYNNYNYTKSRISEKLYSFGENPWKIALWVIAVICAFGFTIFSINEIACYKLSLNQKPFAMVIDNDHIGYYNNITSTDFGKDDLYKNDQNRIESNANACEALLSRYSNDGFIGKLKLLSNSVYISLVTFTTLGFGDYRPIGSAKVFLAIEALLGATLIALFVNAFGRRMAGK